MSTLKMLRELGRELDKEGVTFTVTKTRRAHPKLTITHPCGAVQHLTVGCSPRDEHNQIEDAVREVRRFGKALHEKPKVETKPSAQV